MTTKVRIENVEGNKAIKVGTMNIADFNKVSAADIRRSGFTILSPGESTDVQIHDTKQILVTEAGEYLND